ncbi:MAG TPA: SLC13 family permease [Pyrinomonadaceae bacterium]|jgi:anion transporter
MPQARATKTLDANDRRATEFGPVEEQSGRRPRARETPWRIFAGRILVCVVPPLIWFAPLNLEPRAKHALAITSFMIIAWMTEAFAYALTGFIGCYLFWALGIARFDIAFGGFATEAPWFCFGALLIGMMATKTGLASRLAYQVITRVGSTHSRLFLGFTLVSCLLTFLVPSGAARVVIMAAMALGLMQAVGHGPGTNFGKGIFIILTYTSGLFDKMFIAGSSTILARDLIEKHGHVKVLWSHWFIAFLPCTLVTIIVVWRLALLLFPPEKTAAAGETAYFEDELRSMGRLSKMEKRGALLMLMAICLWMTDFLHHISPAMIGLGTGLLATLPRLGVLDSEDVRRVNYLPVFFVATAAGMGQVLVETKAIDTLTGVMFAWMEPLLNVHTLALTPFWTAITYHIFIGSNGAMLSTSLPPLMNFAAARGINVLALGMIWTFAGGSKVFIYQSALLIVGYSYGYFNGRDLFRFALCMTLIESVMLLPLVSLYWPLIGLG